MRAFSTSFAFILACSLRAISVEIVVQQQPICGHPVGSLFAVANGGVSPYTYSWNTGNNFPSIQGLSAGTYTVTVTDVNADQATAEVVLDALPEWGQIGMGTHLLCDGQAPYGFVSAQYFTIGGDPYTNDLSSAFPLSIDASSTPFFDPAAVPSWVGNGYLVHEGPGPVTVNFMDATGCPGTLYGNIAGDPIEWPTWTSVEAAPSCGPNGNGSITVFRTGGSFASLHGPDNTTYWDTGLDQEEVFQDLDPGGYWLVQNTRTPGPNSFNWDHLPAAQCADSIYVVIPDEGPDCGMLSGTMYIDTDEDCSISSGDLSAGYQILVVEPGPRYVSTDLSGQYTANLPLGSYTIQPANPALLPVCPAGATISSLGTPEQLDVPVIGTAGPAPDLHAWLSSGPARPGFVLTYYLHANNINYGASGNVTATFTADPITTVLSASPTPSTINTGSVVWELADVAPYSWQAFSVQVQVPPDVGLIGTSLVAGFSLTSTNLDLNPGNNTASYSTIVTGSYDPNDKLATTSSRASDELYFIDQDEWIDYTIRFQNTGTDTAFNVVITDTLAATLDPASLQVGAASHPLRWELAYGNVLRFHFDDILLPDSNVNEPLSNGAVQFRIRPKEPVLPGTIIENIANIYFDFNPPVITEPSVLNVVSPIRLDARAWLGGAYDTQTAAMRDDLRAQALVPLTEPYTALGYTHSSDGGGETISSSLLNAIGPTAIVDWVVLELRDPAQPATVLHSRSALLRRDGRITDKDGTSPVAFNAPLGNYRIGLRHRNHLGVISAAPIALSSTATTWDARTTATALFGTAPTIVDGATRLLWPGDGNRDGIVRYAGASNDRDPILQAVGGSVPTAVINGVYNTLDVNLDGSIKYAGANNDRDIILQTIGGTVPTAVRVQQQP